MLLKSLKTLVKIIRKCFYFSQIKFEDRIVDNLKFVTQSNVLQVGSATNQSKCEKFEFCVLTRSHWTC